MEAADAMLAALGQVFSWPECGLLVLGVLIGAIVGILPGLGGSASLAMLMPLTLTLPPSQAFALLLGVAAVIATTGDLTSILVGIPGEAIASATVVDGHRLTLRGEAARAIGASLVSSLAGSLFGALALALAIPFALMIARSIGSPELFMLTLFGVTFLAPLSRGSQLKGVIAGGLGVMLATIGLDPRTSTPRFSFDQIALWDGVGAIPLALGLFAIPEVVLLAESPPPGSVRSGPPVGRVLDGVRDVFRLWPVVVKSSVLGTFVGMIPGVGANIAQWLAYGVAARRPPERAAFGEGAIEGVIAPSAANNATLGGSLIPALALGIPGGVMSALLLSALIMKGLVPGPTMLVPESQGGHLTLAFTFVWLLVAANLLAVALALLGTKALVRITQVSGTRMVPFLLALILVGAFTERQSVVDLFLTAALGALGVAMVRFEWPRAPMLMGLVLAPLAETRLFLSIDAYGAAWLWRPGVLLIAAAIIAGLTVPIRRPFAAATNRERSMAESAFAVALIGVLALAAVVAGAYPDRSSTLPRVVAVLTIMCLSGMLLTTRLRARAHAAGDRAGRAVLGWLLAFIACVWALGFVVGAPLAVLTYFVLGTRERWTVAILSSAAIFVFLYAILVRLLAVPLPLGALLMPVAR
ncbi:MAG TPA: tripartite tricarboxylate transporter permease [Vicinamibacterales bacterium]|nr:tripartite tricarboxylate transporter permease [Vicinamibacterales bacterium]